MKKIFFLTLFIISIICSCNKTIKPLNKNKEYVVNITYVKDNNLAALNPSDFFYIFNSKLPLLTYELLGYRIKYVLKYPSGSCALPISSITLSASFFSSLSGFSANVYATASSHLATSES